MKKSLKNGLVAAMLILGGSTLSFGADKTKDYIQCDNESLNTSFKMLKEKEKGTFDILKDNPTEKVFNKNIYKLIDISKEYENLSNCELNKKNVEQIYDFNIQTKVDRNFLVEVDILMEIDKIIDRSIKTEKEILKEKSSLSDTDFNRLMLSNKENLNFHYELKNEVLKDLKLFYYDIYLTNRHKSFERRLNKLNGDIEKFETETIKLMNRINIQKDLKNDPELTKTIQTLEKYIKEDFKFIEAYKLNQGK